METIKFVGNLKKFKHAAMWWDAQKNEERREERKTIEEELERLEDLDVCGGVTFITILSKG